jgi:hypothetical protein
MTKRKSIVLSDTEKSNKKAVLSLEETDDSVFGTLRLYNFPKDLSGVSSLGFYVNQSVHKAGLTYKSPMLYEFYAPFGEIPKAFSCAVINFQDAHAKAILYGSSDGKDDVYAQIMSEISHDNSFSNTKNVLDKFGVDFDEPEQAEIEQEIDKSMSECNHKCGECVYKKFFFEHNEKTLSQPSSEQKSEEKPKEESPKFIEKLKPQIDKLFAENPIEENLQNMIANSKWTKVDYENDGDFYVFGLIYDESEQVKYVCYGIPAVFEEEPPKELSGYPIWLPLGSSSDGFGYWLTYQDASTGQPIKAVIE